MATMSRTTMLVLVALGATLAGFALSSNARRLQDEPTTTRARPAAGPQRATLGWRETAGEDEQIVFTVDSLEVRDRGWEAKVGVENRTSVPWEIAGPGAPSGHDFGLMLLPTGETSEFEQQNEEGMLPAIREADRIEPAAPRILEPGVSWSGTISAPGALVSDSWVRVVFGPLVPVGDAPEGLPDDGFVWITDRTHRLRP
jgi:hypothetical protein